jgi:hypothetical protein
MKKSLGPRYVIMNGSPGCMPDNYMYADSIRSAIEQIDDLFDGDWMDDDGIIHGGLPRGWKKEIRANYLYYLPDSCACSLGAGYVEISDNTETTWKDIERGMC